MIAALARPLIVVAALGWIVSVVVSLLGLARVEMPEWIPVAVFVGVFPLWVVAVILMTRLSSGVANKELWKAAFRGCPPWLRYAIWASWGYALLMFLITATGNQTGMAGFVGVFYASALGIFVTTATTGDEPAECLNGHPIGPFDKFCRECGAAINRPRNPDLVR